MRRLVWKATGVFSALAVLFAVIWLVRGPAPPGGGDAVPLDSTRWEFTWPEDESFKRLPERFDVSAKVTLPFDARSAVRMLVNARQSGRAGQIERAAFADVSSTAVAVGRIETGFRLEVAQAELDLAPGMEHEVELKRRGAELAVVVDGKLAVLAIEPHLHGGRAAAGVSGNARVQLRPVARLTDLPEFSDDFMRTPEEPGPWIVHSGKWKIESIATPSMSANGFTYRGRSGGGEPALAGAGRETWDRYRAEASVRGEAGGAVGIAFAVRGPERYALFRWRAGGQGRGGSQRQLVLVEPGRWGYPIETVLASAPGGYAPRQWYRLGVEFHPGRARVTVDGHEVLRARRPEFTRGGIALWCEGARGAIFDDVLVTPSRSVEEVFAEAGGSAPPDFGELSRAAWRARWEAIGGQWRSEAGGLRLRRRPRSARGAKLVTGSPSWRRLAAEAQIQASDGTAGVVVNYRDESDYVLLKTDRRRKRCVLERVLAGEPRVLDDAEMPDSGPLTLRVESDRGHLAGYVNGACLVEYYDESCVEGRAGLWCASPRSTTFRTFRAEFLPYEPAATAVNLVFGADAVMADWAGEWADWYGSTESREDRRVYWHRSPFHGDVELAVDLPTIDSPRGGEKVVLGVGKTGDRRRPGNGYGWALEALAPDKGSVGTQWQTTLVREGAVQKRASLDSGRAVESLFIRRRGRYVVAGYDGETVTVFRDEEPLAGSRVAYLARGIAVNPSRVRLYGRRVHDYRFGEAPADWRVAAGVWEIANRWECDRRWSFFIGWPTGWPHPRSGEELTAVWNKRKFPGDVMVDFFVGPKMTGERGRRYEYVRDLNVTIAADGTDISSGYTFMFGGFGNTRSAILRGDKILAETRDIGALYRTNSMVAHQKWFHVRARKTGNRLVYRVGFLGRKLFELKAVDPEPLTGDRVAVWSYDCGIAIARLRIAGSAPGEKEEPVFRPPARVRTPYDGRRRGEIDHTE